MDAFVESLSANPEAQPSSQFALLRFEGLQQVEAKHGKLSQQYQEAALAFKSFLSAAIDAYKAKISPEANVVLVLTSTPAVQPQRRSIEPLAPFRSKKSKRSKRQLGSSSPSIAQSAATVPIVPISRTCFSSADTCSNQTNSCNGRGSCVAGVQAGNSECYVCSCAQNVNGTSFSGEFCQKEDYSSSFFLLAGTAILLLMMTAGSISLLSSAGSEDLPQVLEASSSAGVRKSD